MIKNKTKRKVRSSRNKIKIRRKKKACLFLMKLQAMLRLSSMKLMIPYQKIYPNYNTSISGCMKANILMIESSSFDCFSIIKKKV